MLSKDNIFVTINGFYADLSQLKEGNNVTGNCAQRLADVSTLLSDVTCSPNIFGESLLAQQCATQWQHTHSTLITASGQYEQSYRDIYQRVNSLISEVQSHDVLAAPSISHGVQSEEKMTQ